MAFCKYCGSQIPDGAICGCPQAQAEAARAAAPAQAPQGYPGGAPAQAPQGYPGGAPAQAPQGYPGGAPTQAPQGYPGGAPMQAPQGYPGGVPGRAPQGYPGAAPQGYQPYPAPRPAGPNPFGQAFAQFATFFKHPFGIVSDAFDEKIPTPACFVLGGLYAVVIWIFTMISLLVMGVGGLSVLWGLLAAIFAFGFRFAIAAIIGVFGKNDGLNVKKSISICLVSTMPSTICWVLYGTIGLLGSGIRGFFFVAGIVLACAYYFAALFTYLKSKDRALVCSFVVAAIIGISAAAKYGFDLWMAASAITRSLGSLFGAW